MSTPPPLRAAAGLVALEGIAVCVLAIGDAIAGTDSKRLAYEAAAAVFFVAYGVGLGVCAWGLMRARRWSRGPVLLSQLLLLGLAWSLATGGLRPVAIGVSIVAVLILIGLLHPRSVEALEGTAHTRED